MRVVVVAGLLLTLAACGGTAEPPPAAAAPGKPTRDPTREPTPASARDAACTSAPLTVRVDDIRREGADSLRLALTLSRPATAATGVEAASTADVEAAARALEGLSLVTADGRRRLFALRSSSGERVGPPVQAPPPGGSQAFWALFPAAEGALTVLLPGCAPITGLAVTPAIRPGRPEP
jgi:hypothetical protein